MRSKCGQWSAVSRLALATSALFGLTAHAFVEFPFNKDQHFGPDGPWQAVQLGVQYTTDSTFTTISVYPSVLDGTIAALYIPTKQVCSKYTYSDCVVGGAMGPLPPTNSTSWGSYTYLNEETNYYFHLNGSTTYTNLQFPNNIQMTSALTDILDIGEMTYPSGVTLPIEVGYGCIGGSPLTQSENAPLSLYNGGLAVSNSYGLHIGAATVGYSGSLIFGGYNRGRVIGPVIEFDAHTPLSIIDIEIGVETGDSPFDFEMQTDLLTVPSGSGYTNNLPVLLKPEYPYIYLNKETLANIQQHLPITFDSSSGYYLWDTTDPSYKQIISSPAYLGFVFPSVSGNTANTTIKVPFKLLNLTLEAAASGLDSDRAYIPFMETVVGGDSNLAVLLGRGFLQAAFMGTNWGVNASFLAQAPGPGGDGEGLGYDPVDLDYTAKSLNIQQGDDLFKQSWAGHWTVLSSNNGGGGSGGGDDSSGLSAGVIAGIVVAVVGGLAVIGAIIAFFLIRKKRKARQAAPQQPSYGPPGQEYAPPGPGTPGFAPGTPGFAPGAPGYGYAQPHYSDKPQHHEMHADAPSRQEMDAQEWYAKQNKVPGQEQRYEMSSNITNFAEMPGHEPQELPVNSRTQ